MNWYQIFYWVTVADGVKNFFDIFSNIFTTLMFISGIIYVILLIAVNTGEYSGNIEKGKKWTKHFRTLFLWFLLGTTIMWSGYVFTPTKKDALVIVAGGAIGNFITSDSSSRQIPAEMTLLIREKMRAEIEDIKTGNFLQEDTLKNKTKEELLEILKRK